MSRIPSSEFHPCSEGQLSRRVLCTAPLLPLLFIFCFSLPLQAESPETRSSSTLSSTTESEPVAEVVSIETLKSRLSQLKGQVAVVNFWATWCEPCVEEMPELIEFDRKYRTKSVRFLSVSADHPDDLEDRILPYMKKAEIHFPVLVVGGESPDDLVKAVDPKWQGSLPATFVYDRDGNRVKAWFEKITLSDLQRVLDPLIQPSKEATRSTP